MSETVINTNTSKPCLVTLVKGKKYAWCTCKHSKTQPFCDGSHKVTDMKPLVFKAEADEDVLLCACKATRSGPYCDGSHNNLEDTYSEASLEEVETLKNSVFISRDKGEYGKAILDGGAYVLTPSDDLNDTAGNVHYQAVISEKDGATKLSMHRLKIDVGTSPWLRYADVDTVLYVLEGNGSIDVAGRLVDVTSETGVYIRPSEAFRVIAKTKMIVLATVCPMRTSMAILDKNNTEFDTDLTVRSVPFDRQKATKMADRIYQELIDKKVGSNEVTQFLGEIPKSRAAMHRHLYEEAIVILTGFGRMWTGTMWAEVKAGDILFLPHRQSHSVECTDEKGMRLMGVFYPSGSPAVNY